MKRKYAIEFFDRLKNNQKEWVIDEYKELESSNI